MKSKKPKSKKFPLNDKRSGSFTNLKTLETVPLTWVGNWSNSYEKGVMIPFEAVPKMSIKLNQPYRVQFKCELPYGMPHVVDEFVIFKEMSYERFPELSFKKKHKVHEVEKRQLIFKCINNLDVFKKVAEINEYE